MQDVGDLTDIAETSLAERQEIIAKVQARRAEDSTSLKQLGDATDISERKLQVYGSATTRRIQRVNGGSHSLASGDASRMRCAYLR